VRIISSIIAALTGRIRHGLMLPVTRSAVNLRGNGSHGGDVALGLAHRSDAG
jgi:hypothetical protein